MAVSVSTRLLRIEAALNDIRREACGISILNGARNPERSLQHSEEIEHLANRVLDEAFALGTLYATQINRKK